MGWKLQLVWICNISCSTTCHLAQCSSTFILAISLSSFSLNTNEYVLLKKFQAQGLDVGMSLFGFCAAKGAEITKNQKRPLGVFCPANAKCPASGAQHMHFARPWAVYRPASDKTPSKWQKRPAKCRILRVLVEYFDRRKNNVRFSIRSHFRKQEPQQQRDGRNRMTINRGWHRNASTDINSK